MTFGLLLAAGAVAPALADSPAHTDPVLPVILALAIILVAAKLGGNLASRLGQPPVLGELLVGVALGSLDLIGIPSFEFIQSNQYIEVLAGLGVLVLLFEVGLESTVLEMMRVGASSLLVAVLGVITPFALGWGVGALLLPDHSPYVHAFLGATLTATSVGITARVLKDLHRTGTREAKIILGAAVIDDVFGLVILAVVGSMIQAADAGVAPSATGVGWVLIKAVGFLAVALWAGSLISPRIFAVAARLRGKGTALAAALVPCFGLAALAPAVGLAPIVGAYAAGLVIEQGHYQPLAARGHRPLTDLLQPLTSVLVPVFFVVMGMRVDLQALAHPQVLELAALLTLAAIAGKQVCGLGGLGAPLDRLTIGIGMIPRGEVGLIFASQGRGLTLHGAPILDTTTYATIVLMVMATTLATPPLLRWSLRRRRTAGTEAEMAIP